VPLVFAPWREEVFAPVKLQVLLVLLGVGLISAGLLTAHGRAPRVAFQPWADGAALAFAVTNLAALAFSRDRTASWRGLFPEYQGCATVLAYLTAYGLARWAFEVTAEARRPSADRLSADRLFATLTVATGAVGGYAVVQRCGLDPIWHQAERPFATVGQANSMAAVLVVGLPAVAAAFAARRNRGRGPVAVAMVLGLAGLAVSLSRGGWLAAAVAGGLGLALQRPRPRRGPLLTGLALIAILAGTIAVLPVGREVVARSGARVAAATDDRSPSTAKHLGLATVGLRITLDHPWVGIGQDVFPELAQRYADRYLSRSTADLLRPRRSESPHNALLSISAGAGIPALLAYLALLAAVGRRLLRAHRSGDARAAPMLMIISGYLVSSLFMTPEVSSTVILWIVLGAACSTFPPGLNAAAERLRLEAEGAEIVLAGTSDQVGHGQLQYPRQVRQISHP
jgi:O-antigen ligase